MPAPPRRVVVSNKEIGLRMKLLRLERGLTQVELGKRLDMTQPNLSAIERGARGVTVHQVVKIAKALGASTDEILVAEKAPGPGSRPKKRLMRRLLRIQDLTDSHQKILLDLLDSFVLAAQKKRAKSDKVA